MQEPALDWVDRFVGHLTYERRLSELTCKHYRRDLDALVLHCNAADVSRWSDVDDEHLRGFSAASYRKGLSPGTIRRRLSAARTFFRYLLREKHIARNPVVDVRAPKGAKKLPVYWGKVSDRSQYALFALPIAFTWLMALMGYIRSSVRTHWHVYAVMKDNSPDNFIPTLATVGNMVTGITLLFLAFVLFIFWIANLSGSKQLPPAPEGQVAMAGGAR